MHLYSTLMMACLISRCVKAAIVGRFYDRVSGSNMEKLSLHLPRPKDVGRRPIIPLFNEKPCILRPTKSSREEADPKCLCMA